MTKQKRRVGFYGGAFDPIHTAHLILAQYAIEGLALDQVLFMPSGGQACYKDESPASGIDRIAMIQAALESHPGMSVSDHEVKQGAFCYTIDTLRTLRDEHEENEYILLVGGDWKENIQTWKDGDQLLKEFSIAYFSRPGAQIKQPSPSGANEYTFEMPMIDISSTMIRQRARNGLPIKYLTPEPVRRYIEKHQLYL